MSKTYNLSLLREGAVPTWSGRVFHIVRLLCVKLVSNCFFLDLCEDCLNCGTERNVLSKDEINYAGVLFSRNFYMTVASFNI